MTSQSETCAAANAQEGVTEDAHATCETIVDIDKVVFDDAKPRQTQEETAKSSSQGLPPPAKEQPDKVAVQHNDAKKQVRPNPPSLVNRRCLVWLWRLVLKGFRRPIEQDDIPQVLPGIKANTLAARAEELWLARASSKSNWTVTFILLRIFRKNLLLGIFCSFMHGIIVGVAKPLILRRIINNVESLELQDVILLAVVLMLEAYVQLWMKQIMNDEVVPGVFSSCAALLAKRMPFVAEGLAVTDKQDAKPCVPEPTLIAQDLTRNLENSTMMYMIPSALAQLIAGAVTMVVLLGPLAFIGIAYILAVVFASSQIARVNKKTDKKGLQAADARIGMLRQILQGIRFIKLSAWEGSYLDKLVELRKVEASHYRRYRCYEMLGAALGRTTPVLGSMLTFVSLVLVGHPLKPADVFACLAIFLSLRLPVGVLPQSFVLINSLLLSLQRINKTLSQQQAQMPPLPKDESLAICLENVDLRWSADGAPALQGVCLNVAWGQMVAVVGAVASGKSTLLSAILGGLPASQGVVALCRDAVAFVPQRPVVFSGSVLMNILMGHERDDSCLAKALEVAQFSSDLAIMPQGLATEIGERGTTLSGGQQTRLNIARAIYHQPKLIVADDPLAAVDVHVASAIFAGLQNWMRSDSSAGSPNGQRALIMATNQLHLVPQFDHVVYLEDNTVGVQGAPAELEAAAATRPNLAQLLESAKTAMSVDAMEGSRSDEAPRNDAPSDAPGPARPDKPDDAAGKQALAKTDAPPSKEFVLTKQEHRSRGALEQSIWMQYFRAVSLPWVLTYCFCLVFAYALFAANDLWLSRWMQRTRDGEADNDVDCPVYAGLALAHSAMMLALSVSSGFAGAHASRHLHKLCVSHILRAPMSWYESTPSGRTLSRLSSDLVAVDLKLPSMLDHLCQIMMMMTIIFTTLCVMVPWLLALLVVLLPLYYLLDESVNRSSREIKRITNNAMSPILTLVQEAAQSRLLLRVTGQGPWLLDRTMTCVDTYNSCAYTSQSLIAFLRYVGSMIGAIISAAVCVLLCAWPELVEFAPGGATNLGLALTYTFVIPYFLSFVSMFWSMTRIFMASLERVMELQSSLVPQESAWSLQTDPAREWPAMGAIEFRAATMRYNPSLPPAVHELSLSIAGGERLGVVGRTGAGKSSLSVLLLRIVELSGGSVLIDDVDVSKIGLHALRQAIAVVPQDPFLFEGPLTQNLDPLGKHDRSKLASALESVDLGMSLEDNVGAGGEQLSAGQRQLVAIARATLSSARIVVMDEPTASCDAQTDSQLQQLVRVAFHGRTVICIAHRLNTIIGYDRVLVMEAGRAVELGTPSDLMADSSTRFAQMVARMHASSALPAS